MKNIFTPLSASGFSYLTLSCLLFLLLGNMGFNKVHGQSCTPISTLSCDQLQVNLPYSLSFNSAVAGTLADKNGQGTGFRMVNTYSGTRLSEDGAPSNPSVPGYEPSKLTLTGGQLQIVSNKGIASLTANNQLNALGVKVNSQGKLQIDVSVINPFNGTSYQQAGIWFGFDDKTFLKLVTFNNKVELYKEVNDVSGSADRRITGTITGLETKTVRLRMIVTPATNTVEGFYSIDGTTYTNVGAAYSTPALSISGLGLTSSTAYAGIFATYRNGTTPITYTYDNFSITNPTPAGVISVSPIKLYDNDVADATPGINRVFTIENTSASYTLSVTGISLSGTNANQFVLGGLPAFPVNLAPNASMTFTVAFHPSTSGLKTATLNIASNDANRPSVPVPLRGLGTTGTGGTNEPSLQAILNLLEIPVSVGDDDPNTNVIHSNTTQQKAALLGEEVSMQKFIKAGTGAVTIEPLSVFGPTASNPVLGMGWYKSGDVASKLELFTVSNSPSTNGQTLNVVATGALSFDPGIGSFGFYSRWPFFSNRHLYSEDNLNTFSGAIPHHVRVYPYKDKSGSVVPFAYIVAFEEHTSGFDYQDLVFVVRNVKAALSGNGAPVFSSASYTYSLADNAATGTVAGIVSASDPNSDPVTYAITAGNTNRAFTIDAATGAIKLAKLLNYHTQDKYVLTVRASDPGGLSSVATVTINVTLGTTVSAFSNISWGTAASQPFSVSEAQGEVVNGKLYTFGGFDSQKSCCTPTSRAYVFDPVANTWTAIAPMPPMNGTAYGGVTHAGFTNDGTDIYFAGGYTSNSTGTGQIFGTREVWKYLVSENRYERLPDLPVTISAGQLEYLNGELHHIGGTNSSRTTDLDYHFVLDLDNLTAGWKSLAPLPNPRQHAGSAVNEGKIYYIGGQKGHDANLVTQKDVHRYDTVTNTWTKMADLPVPAGATGIGHISSSVIVMGNQIIVLGGESKHGSPTNMVSSYNPGSNTWSGLTPLPANRSSGVAANLSSTLYYTGGSGSKITYRGTPEFTGGSQVTVSAIADAFVRDGSFVSTNYGFDTTLVVRGTTTTGSIRQTYLKFPLSKVGDVISAKLRIYGRNTENTSIITTFVFGVDNDQWTESGITWNNAPSAVSTAIGTFGVNNVGKYYEVDVTGFVKAQFTKDKILSLLVRDAANQNRTLLFNSRENIRFQPELVITTSSVVPASNTRLFVENLDRFPFNEDDFVASRIQIPWSRDKIVYNTNHDTLRVRLHNKGINPLIISNLALSSKVNWEIVTLRGTAFDEASAFPLTINSGTFGDLQIKFTSPDTLTRVKMILDELTITSNDDKSPYKTLYLRGIWQRKGEGGNEPRAQEIITAYGFKTRTGFTSTDPDKGANNKPKGDEVLTSYFVRVDPTRPVTARQIGAYHGCCNQSETLRWYAKGNSGTLTSLVYHLPEDAQRLLPRRSRSTTYTPSQGSFNPTGAFGFKVGSKDWSDTLLTPNRLIGIRVWKAIDKSGQVIPNAYIIGNDYLGSTATNYDYNDNMYYLTNVRPELGPASASTLLASPSAVEFSEQLLQSTTSVALNLKSLGQVYSSGATDPQITISSIVIVGENAAEFSAAMPVTTVLAPQETTTMNLQFKPTSEGLKTADLLIYYNNATAPLRVPLYGIAKALGTMVSVPYRIKSGSTVNVVVNGKTYVADTPYAFDNLEPYRNTQLTQISATEEDVLYLVEQSSNGDKRPFRYEMPLQNGTYWVRLHFAEIYWGVPGGNLNGGAGSRVMSVHLENQLKMINLDVAAEVGAASAVVKNIPVTVSDGKLNINFSATVNRPMVCAVEVYKFTAGTTSAMDSSSNLVVAAEHHVISNIEKLKVYPNPVHQRFAIEFPASYSGTTNLQLVDITGRIYELGRLHLRAGGSVTEVDVTRLNLTPGVYFLRVLNEHGTLENSKLIVQ